MAFCAKVHAVHGEQATLLASISESRTKGRSVLRYPSSAARIKASERRSIVSGEKPKSGPNDSLSSPGIDTSSLDSGNAGFMTPPNVKSVALRRLGIQSEANEGRSPPLPPTMC